MSRVAEAVCQLEFAVELGDRVLQIAAAEESVDATREREVRVLDALRPSASRRSAFANHPRETANAPRPV